MKNRTYATLWKITGMAAVGLLFATLILAYQVWSQPEAVLIARVTSPNPTVYLRAEPAGTSQIISILERGSTVQVIDRVIAQDVGWLKIESGNFTGWIPEANIVYESQ